MYNLQAIKILVADGHSVVASGIANILSSIEDFQVIGQAKSGEEMFRLFESDFPDVLLIDIDLPGPVSGLELVRRLRRQAPQACVIVLTESS